MKVLFTTPKVAPEECPKRAFDGYCYCPWVEVKEHMFFVGHTRRRSRCPPA